jgi:hypothetical protein
MSGSVRLIAPSPLTGRSTTHQTVTTNPPILINLLWRTKANSMTCVGFENLPDGQRRDDIIVYCVENGDVLILRVVHGRRDLDTLFGRWKSTLKGAIPLGSVPRRSPSVVLLRSHGRVFAIFSAQFLRVRSVCHAFVQAPPFRSSAISSDLFIKPNPLSVTSPCRYGSWISPRKNPLS